MDDFIDALTDHMKKSRLIRVQSFHLREDSGDWNGGQRSNSFTGFGTSGHRTEPLESPLLKRQHTFADSVSRQQYRQNCFLRSLPGSRQNSYCSRATSRGSTGSSFTYSTTSSGVSSGIHSEHSDTTGSNASKSALSRETSIGMLTEFEDIDEDDEHAKTARENSQALRASTESLKPVSPSSNTLTHCPTNKPCSIRPISVSRGVYPAEVICI